jgi:mono/diheme cytochrome c family protein
VRGVLLILFLVAPGPGLGWAASAAPSVGRVDFDRDIRPILSENCYACHGPDKDKRKAGLRLDVKTEAFRPLDSGGFALVPGRPEESRLIKRVTLPLEHEDHMPPRKSGKQLRPAQVELLRRWVEQGAPWADHWAYVPPRRPEPPMVRNRHWPRQDVDRFVLARLEQEHLSPNPEADRYTLMRRLSLDLTGLPPALADVDEFVQDKRADAYERLVEGLLASPHCAERLALAWLDQARYADTSGYHFDGFRQMHLWRDEVIQAFHRNQPFDQFTLEQLAGDLLPEATLDQKIASGFHRNVMTND